MSTAGKTGPSADAAQVSGKHDSIYKELSVKQFVEQPMAIERSRPRHRVGSLTENHNYHIYVGCMSSTP